MAYSFTPRVVAKGVGRGRRWVVIIDEDEAAAADEWSVSGLPPKGVITLMQVERISGSATEMLPRLGKVAGWSNDSLGEINRQAVGDEALYFNEQVPAKYDTRDQEVPGVIFGNAAVDAGADNVIRWVLTIRPDHD